MNLIIKFNHRSLQQHLFLLLQNCKSTRELFQIHAQIVTNGFSQKNYILGKLCSICIARDDLQHARKSFELIERPSTIVWNQMIRGYARSESPYVSIELYSKMVGAEVNADGFTYAFVLMACAKASSASFLLRQEGEQLHGRVLCNGMWCNIFVQTNLVNMYGMGGGDGGLEKARRVFDEMPERSVVTWNLMLAVHLRWGDVGGGSRVFGEMPERNVVSWTTMISALAQNGKCREALALFHEMVRAHEEVDDVAMVAALTACAELGDLKTGRWIHSCVGKALEIGSHPRLVSLSNALMHMYASCGVIGEAYMVFKGMKRRSLVSWTTMITGYAKQGRGKEAIEMFRWMQDMGGEQGTTPDEITFLGLLCACSHTGMVSEARYYFDYMIRSCGIEPKIEHYGCMVDVLSRAGQLDEANKLIEAMPMKPSEVVWGALLGGCRIHKSVEIASHVVHQLRMELEPHRAAGYLVLLSNIYAAAKRWIDVAGVRRSLGDLKARKPSGRSWIQVNGAIHDFAAGDWTHGRANEIYEMADGIARHSKPGNLVLDE
ncbi:hypothetical protein Syun_023489 [Stephania yunnanensis]|uniref:Pentatricopeptide repeat-containing protein n=1 Tax=Stephania yunnanensis TaxID=152371 RepID=A0AAP0FGZ3_9MAGN